MALAAKITSTEIIKQLTDSYIDKYFEACLVYSPGTTYVPGTTNDATFLSNELTEGIGGYSRQVIKYISADIGAYADYGMGLARKAAIFEQDGSATALTFSHICLVRGNGNILTLNTPSTTPSNAIDGTYNGLPSLSSGSGLNALIDLTVSSAGTVFTVAINNAGYGYSNGETLTIQNADLVAAGVCGSADGVLSVTVNSVTTGGGQLYSVSQTDGSVSVTDNNSAVVYFDIKNFGFYN